MLNSCENNVKTTIANSIVQKTMKAMNNDETAGLKPWMCMLHQVELHAVPEHCKQLWGGPPQHHPLQALSCGPSYLLLRVLATTLHYPQVHIYSGHIEMFFHSPSREQESLATIHVTLYTHQWGQPVFDSWQWLDCNIIKVGCPILTDLRILW